MSVAREVAVDYDLQALAEAARKAGMIVTHNARARGWAGSTMAQNCELVITDPKDHYGLDMGFKKMPDGKVKLFADNHGQRVQRTLAEVILPRYIEVMTQRDSRRRFKITQQKQTGQTIEIRVGRA